MMLVWVFFLVIGVMVFLRLRKIWLVFSFLVLLIIFVFDFGMVRFE